MMTAENGSPARSSSFVYAATAVLLLTISLFVGGQHWDSGPNLHTVQEAIGTGLALAVGVLALVRYFAARQYNFLFIGAGFLAIALLDGYHALVSAAFFADILPSAPIRLSPWSWFAGRIFLAAVLLMSWLFWKRGEENLIPRPADEHGVLIGMAIWTVAAFALFAFVPLPRAYLDIPLFPRPAELIPGVLFAVTAVGYWRLGRWRIDGFEHWLLLSLIVNAVAQVAFIARSSALYDPFFDIAHVLRNGSYAMVALGLLASVYATFKRVEDSETSLRDFLDNANDLIQSTAPDGQLLYVNRAWREALGYTEDDIERLNIMEILDPECRDACIAAFQDVLKGQTLRGVEAIFVAKDGHKVSVSGSANCRFENGKPVATRAIFRDVTEQLHAQQELKESEARFRKLVEHGEAIILTHDLDGIIRSTNQAITKHTGYDPRELLRRSLQEFVAPKVRNQFADYLREVKVNGRARGLMEIVARDGSHRVLSYHNTMIELHGQPMILANAQDITERIAAERALHAAKAEAEAANEAKSQFLANMSHELRTPLNSVIGFANILKKNKRGALNADELQYLERIATNGTHLLSLIDDVLDLSRIEAGRMPVEIEPVDLSVLVREIVGQLEGYVRDRPVTLEADLPNGLLEIETDRSRLKQVLINLTSNAVKFTPEGRVTVRARADAGPEGPLAIDVEDSGIGIAADKIDAIFQPFQQAEAGTARRYGGTGLGLSISKSICDLLGCEISVASEVGKGSTFTITVPRRARPRMPGAGPARE